MKYMKATFTDNGTDKYFDSLTDEEKNEIAENAKVLVDELSGDLEAWLLREFEGESG